MIYGVQFSTDSRDRREKLEKFRSMREARRWLEEVGPLGIGEQFAPDNGHRYIRRLYELYGRLPAGEALIDLMQEVRAADRETALARHVRHEGDDVTTPRAA